MGLDNIRFTLFNSITLFLMVLTLWMLACRLLGRVRANWALAYWVVATGYTGGFTYGLHPIPVAGGLGLALMARFGFKAPFLLWADVPLLLYVLWRSAGLILLW